MKKVLFELVSLISRSTLSQITTLSTGVSKQENDFLQSSYSVTIKGQLLDLYSNVNGYVSPPIFGDATFPFFQSLYMLDLTSAFSRKYLIANEWIDEDLFTSRNLLPVFTDDVDHLMVDLEVDNSPVFHLSSESENQLSVMYTDLETMLETIKKYYEDGIISISDSNKEVDYNKLAEISLLYNPTADYWYNGST